MLKSILPLSIATFLSRMTGFFRDYVLYHMIQPGPTLDVFFVAFRFPQLTRRFFAEGSFHQALFPVMGEALKHEDATQYRELYSQSFWFLTSIMFLLSLSMLIGGHTWVQYVLAPGFSVAQQDILVQALRWSTPYSLALAWISLYALILQLHHSYWLNGLSPMLLNLAIVGAAWLYQGDILAILQSMFIIGWVQVLLQAYYAFRIPGLTLTIQRPVWNQPAFNVVLKRFMSLSGLSLMILLNLTIDQIYLSYAPVGSISVYYLCERMIEIPIGVLGYSLWSVFSTYYVRLCHDPIARIRLEHKIALLIIYLIIPASVMVFLFAPEIMALFIDATSQAFQQAVGLLHIISWQIIMIVLNKIFVIIFTINKRNTEILGIHALGCCVNICANALLYPWGARGIAFSTVLTLSTQLMLFHRRYPFLARLKKMPRSLLVRPTIFLIIMLVLLTLTSSLSKFFPKGFLYFPILLSLLCSITMIYLASMKEFFHYLNNRIH